LLFIAALASSVEVSMPSVLPFKSPFSASTFSTKVKSARCVSRSRRWRIRHRVEWSGVFFDRP